VFSGPFFWQKGQNYPGIQPFSYNKKGGH